MIYQPFKNPLLYVIMECFSDIVAAIFILHQPLHHCAFEPVTRRRVKRRIIVEDCEGAATQDEDSTEDRVSNRQPTTRTTHQL